MPLPREAPPSRNERACRFPSLTRTGAAVARYNFHPGQHEAWHSQARFPIVSAARRRHRRRSLRGCDRRYNDEDQETTLQSQQLTTCLKLKMLPEFWSHFVDRSCTLRATGVMRGREQPHVSSCGQQTHPENLESATAGGGI